VSKLARIVERKHEPARRTQPLRGEYPGGLRRPLGSNCVMIRGWSGPIRRRYT
jgi:hypothetical protein